MPKDIPTIRKVKTTGPSAIEVTWKGGSTDHIELAGWIATGGDILAALRDPALFKTALVGEHGAMVIWGDNEDLTIDALHLQLIATEQRVIDGSELDSWQTANGFTNDEAAHILGMSRSTWAAYKSGTAEIPSTVQIAFRAILRDPVITHAHYRPLKGTPGRPPKSAA
jgi:hypothetical protein